MAGRELRGSEMSHLEIATEVTKLQMEAARKLTTEMFTGPMNEQLYAAVLQALSSNYSTTRLFAKPVAK